MLLLLLLLLHVPMLLMLLLMLLRLVLFLLLPSYCPPLRHCWNSGWRSGLDIRARAAATSAAAAPSF